MSQKVELPLDTKCYLCDSYYANIHQVFVVYKCFICLKFTSYCMSCELKLQRLFGKGSFFKCSYCDKLTNALDKIEIEPPNNNKNVNSFNNNSFYKTPSKPFLENNAQISSIRYNNNDNNYFLRMNQQEEERKDNTNKIVISNFLNDFNKIDINFRKQKGNNNPTYNSPFVNTITNNNRNINISNVTKDTNRTLNNSNSISNYNKINDFSLLTSRNRLNKRFCLNESLLGKKRDDSENNVRLNTSRGKFKNLISMKMSKVYKNGKDNNEMDNIRDEQIKKKCEIKTELLSKKNNYGFCDNNDNIVNNSINPFLISNQRGMNLGFIDGKSTPHRLTNNSFEYF